MSEDQIKTEKLRTDTTAIGLDLEAIVTILTAVIEATVSAKTASVIKAVEENTTAVVKQVHNTSKKVYKELLFEAPAFIEQVSDQVALKIVGESYYKWNSVSSFYPTVVFIFREAEPVNRRRRTQIKTRYNVKSEDFTETMLNQLQQNAETLQGLKYNHGIIRGNYVSSDKRFKTTVFGENQRAIEALFGSILSVINEPFQQSNLSFTTGPRRVSEMVLSMPLEMPSL